MRRATGRSWQPDKSRVAGPSLGGFSWTSGGHLRWELDTHREKSYIGIKGAHVSDSQAAVRRFVNGFVNETL